MQNMILRGVKFVGLDTKNLKVKLRLPCSKANRGRTANEWRSISHRLLFTRPISRRQEKTQAARDEEFAKLEKLFADIESKGPCTTYEEFMESEKHHRTKSPVDGE
ncbi:hypothetical protein GQ600_6960 [Phytophthora cactorum]|nr:hypothetical protein GQ600_26445 [Phytophthora cactorum]KAF1789075.1 hypothetical protein GQ600_6960 [Phytophthora cactorum]